MRGLLRRTHEGVRANRDHAEGGVVHPTRHSGPVLEKAVPQGATTPASHPSMPLKDLLTPFLKLSNNNHAEVLVKTIGCEVKGSGTWSAGLSASAEYLRTPGLDPTALRQVDGSGPSRMDMVSTKQFTELLVTTRRQPWFQDWYDALPIACVSDRMTGGTLRSRMCGTAAAGNLHGKTGSSATTTSRARSRASRMRSERHSPPTASRAQSSRTVRPGPSGPRPMRRLQGMSSPDAPTSSAPG
ncbi:D-alanyl-D-alanine carboxypeptidase/D-alanyl-D-alanine-endopeptidase [Streptomyces sp. NPDC056352]|uniref:D-alanyl-D-alanine carboxypeptidase/D-alanyl-D-alanine endopeptidase n=1 Tax=Streptomyces sp. NPDC056352 TaxID=3345791 RepID=UPI0035DAA089